MARHGAAGPRRLALRRWIPYFLLAVTAVLSVRAAAFVASTAAAKRRAEFVADAEETRAHIAVRLDTYVEAVRAGAALVSASNEIHQNEFRAFVRRLEPRRRYPGLDGIGFTPRVSHDDLPAMARGLELDGDGPLRIVPAGVRAAYQPVIFMEPARRDVPPGLDLASDSGQREAMDRARDSGEPALSAPVSGRLRDPLSNSVMLYVPVYRSGASTATVAARRRALYGFVFSPMRPDVLLRRSTAAARHALAVEVYDRHDTQIALIHPAAAPVRAAEDESRGVLSIGGREWLVVVKEEKAADGLPPAAQNALVGGLLLAALLFAITRIQIAAWESAERHAAQLHASEQALRSREAELRDLFAREQAARAAAQEADRAKDDFLAGLSHELRTPLNAMLGWLTMLRSGSVRADRRTRALEVIERNARHQARLIEDLLDVSRIMLGKMSVEPAPMDLAALVASAVESLRPAAATKGVTLQVAPLPSAVRMHGDQARVHQIAWNLLTNAIKFTPAGGLATVALETTGAEAILSVHDTGVGIPAEFLPHVFERFRQADTSTVRSHSGLGLGLAITRNLVELHGGTIEAQSGGTGTGARFVVRFPLLAPSCADADAAHRPAAPAGLERLRVLVVDDDRDTRELLSEALTASGASVMTADSAREAFDRLTRERADVLISDIRMPGEDGISLLKRVRALPGAPGRIPAIALTAYAREHDRADVLRAGYQLHLAKPIELADLEASVARLAAQAGGPAVAASA